MNDTIKIGESGVVNFVVCCEDNESIVERRGIVEVKLLTNENEGNRDITLELKTSEGFPEKPLHKKQIRHIELRAVVQEKDPNTEEVVLQAVKHYFFVEPICIVNNLERYSVAHWKTFIDGKKIRDIRA